MEIQKEEINKSVDWLERMKEIQRLQFDYFKHITTLSTGAILVGIAFLEKIFSKSHICGSIFILISFWLFGLTIFFSLNAMQNAGNMILYINGLQKATIHNERDTAISMQNKIDGALKNINQLDKLTKCLYAFGIAALLISAILFFILNKKI